jgi:hypothetical protein
MRLRLRAGTQFLPSVSAARRAVGFPLARIPRRRGVRAGGPRPYYRACVRRRWRNSRSGAAAACVLDLGCQEQAGREGLEKSRSGAA